MDNAEDAVAKLLRRCRPSEVEVEARIRKHLVSRESQQLLLDGLGTEWQTTTYNERRKISKSDRGCAYRQRDYARATETICKSSIAREEVNDMWCVLHVSVEVATPSMSGYLAGVEPSTITRHRAELEGHYVDIVCSGSEYRVEVEVCDAGSFSIEHTLPLVKRVCTLLQGSGAFVGYYDWYTVMHVARSRYGPFCIDYRCYQKPYTMTIQSMLEVKSSGSWAVTPKVDGERRFIVAIDNRAFSIGLKRDVRLEGDIPDNTGILILDCEYTNGNNTFHVFDAPVGCGEYIGDMPMYSRLEAANVCFASTHKAHIVMKGYTGFGSFDELCKLCNWMVSGGQATDGVVFARTDTGYMQRVYKWKPHSTVDLMVTAAGGLTTCDGCSIGIPVVGQGVGPGVWEFGFDGKNLYPKRPRPDKPQANSRQIVVSNIRHAVPGSVFSGVGCYLMRKYHNRVKGRMIRGANCVGAVILDIGTGQGGDVAKWRGARKVHCVEPSRDSTEDMHSRYGDIEGVTVHNVPLRDLDVKLITDRVDIFTAFFCMNQFREADWDSLRGLVRLRGSKNCRLLAIAMTSPRDHNSECFKISTSGSAYNISIYGTRVMDVNENIVDSNALAERMKMCGLNQVNRGKLNGEIFMTRKERALSSMYEMFVYKKA